MKGVPEEEEDIEGEVWSSLTTPPPKIPIPCQVHALDIALQQEEDDEDGEGYWDPEDLDGIPEPPDGGWGWVIVAASFLCNTVVDGIAYSFGIFLVHFVNYYGSPKGKTAWVGSLLSGCYLSAGPIVSALTNKFGCRPVTIAGSILSCAAFLLSTAAPNVDVLMFTYGIMGGIGFGLIYLPAIVSVGYYFSTKRAFATGIAVCGSGMGAFIFAPVTQYLLELYDWKGALIVMAGLSLNCAVFGALMRPLEPRKNSQKGPKCTIEISRPRNSMDKADSGLVLTKDDQNLQPSVLNTEPGVQSTLNINEVARKMSELPGLAPLPSEELHNSVDAVPAVGVIVTTDANHQSLHPSITTSGQPPEGFQQSSLGTLEQNKLIVPPNGAIKMYLSHGCMREQRRFTMPAMPVSENVLCPTANNNYLIQRRSTGRGSSWMGQGAPPRRRKVSNRRDLARPLYRKDIFYSGSIAHLPQFQHSRNDVRSYVASVTSIPRTDSLTSEPKEEEKRRRCPFHCRLPKSMGDTLREVLDFSLLKEPPFLLACIANVFGMMGFYIPFVYITDSSIQKGISEERSAFLLSILGITNLIGRLVFGWVVDRPKVRALDVNNVCLTLSGIGALVVPFCFNYASIVAACSIFSVFVSAYISLTSIILVEMLGLDKLTNSFGLLSLFRGAASIVGPPLAGTVYDLTGSYDIPFYLAGSLLMMSALLTFFVPYLIRRSQKKLQVDTLLPKEISVASDTDSGRPESITVTEVMTAL